MDQQRIEITTSTGGAATKTTVSMNGLFYGFALVLGTATSVDVTIQNAEGLTLYTKAGLAANALIPVAKNQVDPTGTAISGAYVLLAVMGPLTITIANGGNGLTLSIIVYVVN